MLFLGCKLFGFSFFSYSSEKDEDIDGVKLFIDLLEIILCSFGD